MALLSAQGWTHRRLLQRQEIKKVATPRPGDYALPFYTWSLSKLADFLGAEGVVGASATTGSGSCSARKASASNA